MNGETEQRVLEIVLARRGEDSQPEVGRQRLLSAAPIGTGLPDGTLYPRHPNARLFENPPGLALPGRHHRRRSLGIVSHQHHHRRLNDWPGGLRQSTSAVNQKHDHAGGARQQKHPAPPCSSCDSAHVVLLRRWGGGGDVGPKERLPQCTEPRFRVRPRSNVGQSVTYWC